MDPYGPYFQPCDDQSQLSPVQWQTGAFSQNPQRTGHPSQNPLPLQDAKRITGDFIDYYNTQRLHPTIGYITPADRLAGRQDEIHAARDKKLEPARQATWLEENRTLLAGHHLPSYSPELNPDEHLNHSLKSELGHLPAARDEPSLQKQIMGRLRSCQQQPQRILSFFTSPSTSHAS